MPRRKSADAELAPFQELDELADRMGLPRQWLVCPMCAEFFWRFPPHGFGPCPVAAAMADSTGMKLDAERMTAVRAGVHLEQMSAAMRQFVEEYGDSEEADDDNE